MSKAIPALEELAASGRKRHRGNSNTIRGSTKTSRNTKERHPNQTVRLSSGIRESPWGRPQPAEALEGQACAECSWVQDSRLWKISEAEAEGRGITRKMLSVLNPTSKARQSPVTSSSGDFLDGPVTRSSTPPLHRAQVRPLVSDLDPTCLN